MRRVNHQWSLKGGGVAPETQTITRGISLVSIVIGERLATTLSGASMPPADLADTQPLAVERPEQVTAGVKHARRVACPLVVPGPATRWHDANREEIDVIVSQ